MNVTIINKKPSEIMLANMHVYITHNNYSFKIFAQKINKKEQKTNKQQLTILTGVGMNERRFFLSLCGVELTGGWTVSGSRGRVKVSPTAGREGQSAPSDSMLLRLRVGTAACV